MEKLSRNCCARDPMEARSRIPPNRAVGAAYAASPCYAASQAFLRKKTRGASSRTLLGRITKRRRKLQSSAQVPRCVATEAISGGRSRSRSAQPRASPGGKLVASGSTWGQACGQQPPRTEGARIGGRPGRVGKGFARRRMSRATGRLRATSPPGWGRTGGRFGRSTGRSGRYASTSPPVGSARYLRPTNIRPV